MRRAKDQHLVQALGAYSANQPLHIWILPRRVCRQKLSWAFGAIHVYVAAAGEGAAGGAERSSLSKTTHIGGSKDISCGWQFVLWLAIREVRTDKGHQRVLLRRRIEAWPAQPIDGAVATD